MIAHAAMQRQLLAKCRLKCDETCCTPLLALSKPSQFTRARPPSQLRCGYNARCFKAASRRASWMQTNAPPLTDLSRGLLLAEKGFTDSFPAASTVCTAARLAVQGHPQCNRHRRDARMQARFLLLLRIGTATGCAPHTRHIGDGATWVGQELHQCCLRGDLPSAPAHNKGRGRRRGKWP